MLNPATHQRAHATREVVVTGVCGGRNEGIGVDEGLEVWRRGELRMRVATLGVCNSS